MNLYYCDIRQLTDDMMSLRSLLPAERRKKMDSYRHNEDKLRCLGGGLLLRSHFGENYASRLSYNPYGKPLLKDGACFNLSHSGDYVVLAVSADPVGVDIQLHGEADYVALAERSFHPDEQKLLASSPNQKETFHTIWSLKESYIKALGTGFSLEPSSFCVNFDDGKIKLSALHNLPHFCLYSVPFLDGYSLAVCLKNPVETIRLLPLELPIRK